MAVRYTGGGDFLRNTKGGFYVVNRCMCNSRSSKNNLLLVGVDSLIHAETRVWRGTCICLAFVLKNLHCQTFRLSTALNKVIAAHKHPKKLGNTLWTANPRQDYILMKTYMLVETPLWGPEWGLPFQLIFPLSFYARSTYTYMYIPFFIIHRWISELFTLRELYTCIYTAL